MKKISNRRQSKKLKDKLKENNALTKAVSAIALIIIIAGLFALIIVGLRSSDLFRLPDFLENLFFGVNDDGEAIKADDGDIYDYLSADELEGGGFSIEISLENVREIISGINLPDNLHLETTAEYYSRGRVSKRVEMSLWKKEEKYKYTVKSNGEPEELYINDGRFEYIENSVTGSSIRRTANKNFNFESVPHIKDINYYLDLIDGGSIINYEVHRGRGIEIEESIIIIIYEIEELNQRERIQISLDNGIVLSVTCEVDGVLYYKSETSVKAEYFTGHEPEINALTDDIFIIN
jgi:hypothetical protein